MGMNKRLYILKAALVFLIFLAIKTVAYIPNKAVCDNLDLEYYFLDLEYSSVDEPSLLFEFSENDQELKTDFGIAFHNPFQYKSTKEPIVLNQCSNQHFSYLILFVTDTSPPFSG